MSGQLSRQGNVTIFDVAKESGVSYSTVSRVVNDFPHVKPETRERVQSAMEKLGYSPNLKARSLKEGRSQMLGLVLFDFESGYHVDIMRGIDGEVALLNYDLMLSTTHHGRRKESAIVTKLMQGLVDGLLIVVPQSLDDYLDKLNSRQFPYVLIDQGAVETTRNTIQSQNRQGSMEATRYLLSKGHRRIGFVEGALEINGARERLAGYNEALTEHGIDMVPSLVQPGDFTRLSGYDAVHHFLALEHPPTAVIASNDLCACGVIEGLLAEGVRVPEDVSVIGFDDIPEASTIRPSLTTMRQDLRQMGRQATRMLIQVIDDPNHPNQHVEIPMELIIRESTASPENSIFWQNAN